MRRFVAALLLSFSVVCPAGDAPLREAPEILNAADAGIGKVISDVSLIDLESAATPLSKVCGKKATVIAVWTPNCPISKKYTPTIAALAKDFAAKDVAFLLANFSDDSATVLRDAIKLHGLSMPLLMDSSGVLRRELKAKTTTEVFVLSPERKLLYRGAIDDQYGTGYAHDAPRAQYLRDALEAALSGSEIKVAATSAPGCELPPETATDAKPAVTFYRDVLPIVQRKCQECHRANGGAPFSLMTYDDVRRKARVMKRVTERRTMPPWFADEKVGGPWANDRSLSEKEIATLGAWADAGTPEGDPKDAPPARVFAEGWHIGKPDLIFQIPKPVKVPATGTMPYQYIKAETNLKEDTWVQAVELLPTNPEVVHHSQVFLVVNGKETCEKGQEVGGRGEVYFAAMAPGETVQQFPEGSAKLIPKGATLLFEIHYAPSGVETEDQIRVGVILAKQKPKLEVKSFDIRNMKLDIAPGQADYKESAEYTFAKPTRLISFQPHMHLRGKAFAFDLIYPDGKTQQVLNVPRYDFRWQLSYRLQTPIDIPPGSKLKVTGWFDNSANNPANPDPKLRVKGGGETTDEMLVGFGEWCEIPQK